MSYCLELRIEVTNLKEDFNYFTISLTPLKWDKYVKRAIL